MKRCLSGWKKKDKDGEEENENGKENENENEDEDEGRSVRMKGRTWQPHTLTAQKQSASR
jgi:hypothetical protein